MSKYFPESRRFYILAVVLFLYFPILLKAQDTLENDIKLVLSGQVQAWNDNNIEKYMAGYWKSDSLLFTSGGTYRRGWKATLEKYRKTYSDSSKMGKLKFSDLEVQLLSPESAWVFGKWELERKMDHPGGLFTLIFRKFPEGWKIIHDHTSSFPPKQ